MARILVVDDERGVRQLLDAVLTDEGHTVDSAANGNEALSKIRVNPPDLVVLDIMMPGMDGFAVLREMKATGLGYIRVLILTARTSEADHMEGYRLGALLYVTKPFDADELCVAVQEVLTSSRSELAARREQELARASLLTQLESAFDF